MLQILSIWNTIWETLQNWSVALREFVLRNYTNPLLWIGIIVFAFVFFKSVYSTLNRER